MLAYASLFLIALAAGALGGLVGTGSSLVLLPVLVTMYGPRVAVPIMAVAAVMANVGRVAAWWKHIRWRPVLAYAVPGMPAAVLGAHTLLTIPQAVVENVLGGFFLLMIPIRRVIAVRQWRLRLWQLGGAGGVVGFLTGLILSTGPLSVPVFTGYGLTGGSFLGTEAASAMVLYLAKMATFGQFGALNHSVLVRGVAIGAALMIGPFLARPLVRRLHARTYGLLIDLVLLVAGVGLFVTTLGSSR
ncbi:sulfite exporter TauE/SafE family protein [Mycobacterium sp. 050134]|uniref:sulfite exporter TauE/SafE family protein n=1 Tax=Mycobacterium sp. 050134 TaxID=3096111 RepID=UPI002ED9D701